MRIGRMYFHTSIFISRQDVQGSITLKLKFPISKDSIFKDQEFILKNWQRSFQKKSRGRAPHPLLTREAFPPPRWVLNVWPQWHLITRTVHFAEMKLFFGSRIFERSINYIKQAAFTAFLKSTKIAVFQKWTEINFGLQPDDHLEFQKTVMKFFESYTLRLKTAPY